MSMTYTSPEALAASPADMKFLADTLAESASNDRRFKQRVAYQILRDLPAGELHRLYAVWSRDGNAAFREAFAPVYAGVTAPAHESEPVSLEEDDTSDKIRRTENGDIDLESFIEFLEEEPSREEIREGGKDLRRDMVKHALAETVKAAQFDRDRLFAEFLLDGEKSARTAQTYRHECGRLFQWAENQGKHLTQLSRADVNRFKAYLSERYSANTVRVCLASCSSFFGYLEAEGVIDSTPFARITYPKRRYKKAEHPNSSRPEVVPSSEEHERVAKSLLRKATAPGETHQDETARQSARRALVALELMRRYGLRVSSVPTVEIATTRDRFAYMVKGGEVKQKVLDDWTKKLLKELGVSSRRPLEGVSKGGLQNRLHRETRELAAAGRIRRPFSAHDWRHLRALEVYRNTGDVYAVKRELDHASVSATEHYLAGLGALEAGSPS